VCLGSYGRGVLVLILALGSRSCGERGGDQGEGAASVGRGEKVGVGYACVAGRGIREKDYSDMVGVRHVSAGSFGTVR
jgi:hypothetical protein